ncbi:hypothetical protein ABXN37_19835 [Piscinibacter sakaiensis]|uniref:Uncharacterized protein n=1 Tax=Piscinibacter sakaiensis TaxID=1547922 RepID=A0A0K8P446_PISS1|nr:hypothetical protein [Piscinibacter sakaiensis]GAP37376.1 hypothetical protein ISF6_3231 [Piscinibacter sakaiensis]
MAKGAGQTAETEQQRALAEVGRQQLMDWRQRWLPVQEKFGKQVEQLADPNSFQRRRATAMAGIDTTAKFGAAQQSLDQGMAATGRTGSTAHKLAIAGLGDDAATSAGLSKAAADAAIDDERVAGLGAMTALGRGEKASAINGLATSATVSARQAGADARAALQRRLGDAQLAGTAIGLAGGLAGTGAADVPGDVGIVPQDSPLSATGAAIRGRR